VRNHSGAGEKYEEKRAAKRSCNGLASISIPHPSVLAGGGRRQRSQE